MEPAWAAASSRLMSEVYRKGIITARTRSGPKASAATARARAETKPAEKPNTTVFKPIFIDIVPHAHHKRTVNICLHRRFCRQRLGYGLATAVKHEIDREKALIELRHFYCERTGVVVNHGATIEHQLILSPYQIGVDDTHLIIPRLALKQRLTSGLLVDIIG